MIDMLDMKVSVQNLTPENLIWCHISNMTDGEQLLIKIEF